ncbi:transglycosylase SLT domain-containing protein [Rhodobacteraceae bacterium M382]|nr:transglycosylase SLT domain-containing protein [Rhodobacteraceae bacterium M382]
MPRANIIRRGDVQPPKRKWTVLSLVVLGFPVCAHAITPQTSGLSTCDQAAFEAASRSGVPYDILRTITRLETGRHRQPDGLQPWPWTVNMEGAGHWFADKDQALAFVFRHFKLGARSFDLGCFQINFKWHGSAFQSIEEMFNPMSNADYAASFLKSLYAEYGNWEEAAGAYHSRTPKYAVAYSDRFEKIHSQLNDAKTLSARAVSKTPSHENTWSVNENGAVSALISGSSPRMGSLVPMGGRSNTARATIEFQ